MEKLGNKKAIIGFLLVSMFMLIVKFFLAPMLFNKFFEIDTFSEYMVGIACAEELLFTFGGAMLVQKLIGKPNDEKGVKKEGNEAFILILLILSGVLASVGTTSMVEGLAWLKIGICKKSYEYDVLGKKSLLFLIKYSLCLGIVPSVCEEYFFRETAFGVFKDKKIGAFLGLVLFVLSHVGDWKNTVFSLIVGIACMLIYGKYGNIEICICIHCIFNLVSILFSYGIFTPGEELFVHGLIRTDSAFLFFGVLFFAIGLILTVYALYLMEILKTPRPRHGENEEAINSR